MPETLTVTEIARSFAEYINRVVYRGESFILTRGNKPVAEIRPLRKGVTGKELLEIFQSLPHLSPENAEAFAKDVYEARDSARVEDYNPWQR